MPAKIPSTNVQHPEKLQNPNSKLRTQCFGPWTLRLLWSLDVGAWYLANGDSPQLRRRSRGITAVKSGRSLSAAARDRKARARPSLPQLALLAEERTDHGVRGPRVGSAVLNW